MAGENERRVEIVVCEKHGLRYNAAEAGGCVRCRREAGEVVAAGAAGTSAAGARPAAARAAAERPANALVQLLLAAALIGGTGTLFWTVHREMVAGLGGMFTAGAEDLLDEADGRVSFEEVGADPASYPPADGVAFGPAEQERQINEVMRQMQQDDEADARAAERAAERESADDYGDGQ